MRRLGLGLGSYLAHECGLVRHQLHLARVRVGIRLRAGVGIRVRVRVRVRIRVRVRLRVRVRVRLRVRFRVRVRVGVTEVASTERYRMAVPNSSCNVWSSVSIEDWRSMSKPQRASSHMSSRGLVRGRVRANPNPNRQP